MRTSKPIATISYNTRDFLKQQLDALIRNHKISDYMFIKHYPESDERKAHFHLWIKPNTLLDTMDLQNHFQELDLNNPLKPLKCIDFRSSSVDDWILYCQHYAPYLASKSENREFHYQKSDFEYYDEDTFDDLYYHALKGSEWAKKNQILQSLTDNHLSPAELISNGTVPLNLASQLNAFYYMRSHYGLDRNGRPNHENDNNDQ